ncbi:MAG TPA: hypothetical protein VFH11_03915 [Gemmatimonadota bacterium]|nr:hypothetical protein [Gemmatimonadota bacterium]
MRMRIALPAVMATALALPACSGESGPTRIEIPLASVELEEGGCSTLAEGTTCQMQARGITAEGQIVTNAILRWSTSAGNVAQVNDEGLVFAVGTGVAIVTVEAAFGQGEDSVQIAVVPAAPK